MSDTDISQSSSVEQSTEAATYSPPNRPHGVAANKSASQCAEAATASPVLQPQAVPAKPSKRDQKPCPQCGKMFGRTIYNGYTQSPSGFARRIYCSHRCRADSQIKKQEGEIVLSSFVFQKRCPNCNKLFGLRTDAKGKQQTPSSFKRKRFCSIICGAIAHATAMKAKEAGA